jgi:hypothetical protein
MAFDNNNRGILSKNQNKTADNHPEYSGSINIDGTDYWLSAWIKESSKDGKKFFSLSVKPKDAVKQKPKAMQEDDFPESGCCEMGSWNLITASHRSSE